ncbi:MAG: hybrid sensor histidine kinase/response regulator [Bacteroidota bacterium]|nr:hybrid sensor histidine kinase/response regulator [Candidatus Kapabacteria bacterium]MDW8221059.1 hybrid sensor histidine kinase/response regulator [Bacteroidota bacterium]
MYFVDTLTHHALSDAGEYAHRRIQPVISSTNDAWILVADDVEDNVNIIRTILEYKGYHVQTAINREQVLEQVRKHAPDLILLDIQMPQISGFEICRELKAHELYNAIPIIFLTAKADSCDVIDGFKAGAVDYIVKPFNAVELLARVHTHLELKRMRDLLAAKNTYLEVMTHGLKKLNNEKNALIEFAAHDLKSPLSTIKGIAEFIRRESELPAETMRAMLANIIRAADRMFAIIRNLLDVSIIEEGNLHFDCSPVDVHEVLLNIVDMYSQYSLGVKNLELQLTVPEGISAVIRGNADILTHVFDNLVSNALKYAPAGTVISICLSVCNGYVYCEIHNEGEGLTADVLDNIFSKHAKLSVQSSAEDVSSGLGLYIAQKLTHAMHGRITCRSLPGQGVTFVLEFPVLEM